MKTILLCNIYSHWYTKTDFRPSHTFSELSHSFLPYDRSFGLVESQKRRPDMFRRTGIKSSKTAPESLKSFQRRQSWNIIDIVYSCVAYTKTFSCPHKNSSGLRLVMLLALEPDLDNQSVSCLAVKLKCAGLRHAGTMPGAY
ncbi:hypothetical protein ANN_23780 [Periplaneta americana]|uniref:Uncharacterized protein n=1 Tax=Periplaneta americana TaxID=6978 RepID=A0ABQ8SMH4_PERAM|nr:hypothetical protein ANN_23780 [Periplaneta americana]